MSLENEGYFSGRKEAIQLLQKLKPKLTSTTIRKVQHPLKLKLETEYATRSPRWKKGYANGAFDAISHYTRNLYEKGWKK